jgi:isocitrate dehydrogenase kinase/phosphatase
MKIIIKYLWVVMLAININSAYALTSSEVTSDAWEALQEEDWHAAIKITEKCIKLFEEEALKQQAMLNQFPSPEETPEYWALNDVGTCYYIQCQALEKLGSAQQDKLEAALKKIVSELSYAQSWDEKGWYWQVAPEAKKKLRQLEFKKLMQ